MESDHPIHSAHTLPWSAFRARSWILTHDFTHRTHAVVFGYQYPRSLPDWSSDDWITKVRSKVPRFSPRLSSWAIAVHGAT